jgi:hypothetical protein
MYLEFAPPVSIRSGSRSYIQGKYYNKADHPNIESEGDDESKAQKKHGSSPVFPADITRISSLRSLLALQ